jgi:hypothetical protein
MVRDTRACGSEAHLGRRCRTGRGAAGSRWANFDISDITVAGTRLVVGRGAGQAAARAAGKTWGGSKPGAR